jgi:hypothetical protein
MKFSFPFFKKKIDPPFEKAEEEAIEQAADMVTSPQVDWESVGVDGFVPPSASIPSDPADGMASFEALDLPPLRVAEPRVDKVAEIVTSPSSDPVAIPTTVAAEPEDDIIPTPVKVAPQTSAPMPMEAAEPTPQLETKPESQPEAQPESQPEAQPESQPVTQPVTQPASQQLLRMTKEDVIAAYKIFLNRLPESVTVMNLRIGGSTEANLIDFVLADEFLKRPEVSPLILGLAKQIIERQKASGVPTEPPVVSKGA